MGAFSQLITSILIIAAFWVTIITFHYLYSTQHLHLLLKTAYSNNSFGNLSLIEKGAIAQIQTQQSSATASVWVWIPSSKNNEQIQRIGMLNWIKKLLFIWVLILYVAFIIISNSVLVKKPYKHMSLDVLWGTSGLYQQTNYSNFMQVFPSWESNQLAINS